MGTEFDSHSENYIETVQDSVWFSGQEHSFFIEEKARVFNKLIHTKFRNKKIKILDVGCGHGLILPFLASEQYQLSGCDVAKMPLTHAKKICPQALLCIQHDSEKLPFEDDYFDFTYTVCVLHHVPVEKWEKFLSEMYRVTRKDGLVAVIEHNPINPLTQLIVRTCELDKNAVLVGSRKMKQLMEKAGLSKVKINYILFTPWRGKFFRVFDESINWLPIGAQYIALGHKS